MKPMNEQSLDQTGRIVEGTMEEVMDGETEIQLEQLKEIYKTYERELATVLQNAKPLAGWFGVSNDDPRYAPCHQTFYDAVGKWVDDFAALEPEPVWAKQAVVRILEAASQNRGKQSYWYYLAAQSYVKKLLPFLKKEHCQMLVKWYDKTYPRRERLPVNDELYSLMKKAAK